MCLGIALSPGATGGAVKFGGLIGKTEARGASCAQ